MALGGCAIVSSTPQNLEVVGSAGWSFERGSEESLVEQLQYVVDRPDEADAIRDRARSRVEAVYSWEGVTRAYERLMAETARR
jgi:glycosyltransferase involved in cell wall biosynthesis